MSAGPGGGSGARPAYSGAEAGRMNSYPGTSPAGHLSSWLNQHSHLPTQDQERMLRADPSFKRLAPGEQQRLVQQLHQVDNLNEQQRQRRLARAEALEHLSPQERMSLNRSNQAFSALPAARQTMVKRAFQDLRSVPLDQRQMMLNSAHYQNAFTPEERNILTDFLRVEPYASLR